MGHHGLLIRVLAHVQLDCMQMAWVISLPVLDGLVSGVVSPVLPASTSAGPYLQQRFMFIS